MAKEYCLKKKKSTRELHLFECEPTTTSCICPDLSICNKMKKNDSVGDNLFSCLTEDDARRECARIGRDVCGTCVSHLYATYD